MNCSRFSWGIFERSKMNHVGSSLLLKPARDLERNWDIDVASELEAYLTHVEQQAQQAREGGITGSKRDAEDDPYCRINFIEAALMLQSGTSIYSKKVEYLLALTYRALNNFTDSGKNYEQTQDTLARRPGRALGRKIGRCGDDWDIMDAFFVPWNVAPKEKFQHYFLTHEGDGCVLADHYICQCNESVILSQSELKKLYCDFDQLESQSQPRIEQIHLLLAPRDDRDELRVTSLIPHPLSGALLVDSQDALQKINCNFSSDSLILYDFGLSRDASAYSTHSSSRTPFALFNPLSSQQQDTPALSINPRPATSDRQSDIFSMQEQTPVADVTRPLSHSSDLSISSTTHPVATDYDIGALTETKNEQKRWAQKSRLDRNPLERLNCHQSLGRNKVQQSGDTIRKPDASVYLASAETLSYERYLIFSQLQRCSFIGSRWFYDSLNESLSKIELPFKSIPTFPDLKSPTLILADSYKFGPTWAFLESKWIAAARKASTSRLNDAKSFADHQKTGRPNTEGDMSRTLGDLQDQDTSDILNLDFVLKSSQNHDEENERMSNSNDFSRLALVANDIESAVTKSELLYDDFLENNTGSAPDQELLDNSIVHGDRTGLRQRVSRWRDIVERWLNSVNQAPWFDVQLYRESFSRKLLEKKPNQGKTKFRDIVSGCQRSDVCRYFLISLLLCNEQYISIEPDNTSDFGFCIVSRDSEHDQIFETKEKVVQLLQSNIKTKHSRKKFRKIK